MAQHGALLSLLRVVIVRLRKTVLYCVSSSFPFLLFKLDTKTREQRSLDKVFVVRVLRKVRENTFFSVKRAGGKRSPEETGLRVLVGSRRKSKKRRIFRACPR